MLSHVMSILLKTLHSTHAALQLKPPQSPLLTCRRNILFPANLYPLKRRKHLYILYIHTCASNLFIIDDDIVSFFYLYTYMYPVYRTSHLCFCGRVSVCLRASTAQLQIFLEEQRSSLTLFSYLQPRFPNLVPQPLSAISFCYF